MSDIRKRIIYIECEDYECPHFRHGHASALHAAGRIAADADTQIADLESRLAAAERRAETRENLIINHAQHAGMDTSQNSWKGCSNWLFGWIIENTKESSE